MLKIQEKDFFSECTFLKLTLTFMYSSPKCQKFKLSILD